MECVGQTLPFRSLYVHVPFCHGGKCDYCAFASQGNSTAGERLRYLQALEEEFRRKAPFCEPLRSIFIGGGTPSSLEASELSAVLTAIRRNFLLLPDCEWSCEANPDSLTPEKLGVLLEGGVNRLSLGVQSFHEELRKRIGRRGSLEALPELVCQARKGGLRRLNLDLIYAIPGETAGQWREDLERALEFAPEHLSCYSLILEEGTPLAGRLKPQEDDDRLFLECWELNDSLLSSAGLHRYEISNFARDGFRCRHNDEVWHGQTYLGCGPAAVSFDGVARSANPSLLAEWLDGIPPEVDLLGAVARRREVLAFGMRTLEGWSWDALQRITGLAKEGVLALPACGELLLEGLVQWDETGIRPTARGVLFNDRVVGAFLA